MAESSVNVNGIATGENLRKNVLLAAAVPATTTVTMTNLKANPTISTDECAEENSNKDSTLKYGFWQNVINFRENMSKNVCVEIPDKSGESAKNSNVGSITTFVLSKRNKNRSEAEGGGSDDDHSADGNSSDHDDGDCISELIGHIGLWQIAWSIFLIVAQVPSAFHIFSFMFQAVERDYWCAPPASVNISVAEWRNISQPFGSCLIVKNLTIAALNQSIDERWMPPTDRYVDMEKCTRFQFDTSISETTIQSEWNVVCDDATLLSVIEMCFLAGAAIGSLSSGSMSDEFGRRHTLMIFVALQAIIGTSLGLVKSLIPYMILRFTLGFVSMSMVNISFVLAVELVTGKWSTIIGMLDLLPIPLSYILISGIAYVTRDWRILQLIVSVPWFGLLPFWFFLPESPRWLLATGRVDKLKKIIELAASWNKRILPNNYEKLLLHPSDADFDSSNGSMLDLFKIKYLRTTLLLLVAWYALVLQYMAITLHIGEMGGNIFVITAYAGLFESIAIILAFFTVLRFGIQKNIFYLILIAGISLMYIALFPNADWTLVVVLAMLGKSTTGVANAVIPTFTSLQYPPTLRTRAIGLTNFSAGFALITVPYIWLLKHIKGYLPPLLLGICGLIGALALFFIDDKTAIMMKAERRPSSVAKIRTSQQQQLGK